MVREKENHGNRKEGEGGRAESVKHKAEKLIKKVTKLQGRGAEGISLRTSDAVLRFYFSSKLEYHIMDIHDGFFPHASNSLDHA